MHSGVLKRAPRILSDLIAMPTVNPMGAGYTGSESVERKALDYIARLFEPYRVEICYQRCGPAHENLVVSCPGKRNDGFTLLESHADTVPAADWLETAFTPRRSGDLIYGRGACDDKGPLTSMTLAVIAVLEAGLLPPSPVLLVAAGDEEYAQTGIKTFAQTTNGIERAVIGEATSLAPILQHKGTVRWDITVHGVSAHTSCPELGRNAILGAFELIECLKSYQRELQTRFVNELMTGPTITVTMIRGGRTRNAVPDECTVAVDFRVIPRMDPAAARLELIDYVRRLPLELSHGEPQLITPPLNTHRDDPFSRSVLEICRARTGRAGMNFAGAPYGTDASWVAAPAIVLGPGSIESAHAIDEHIDLCEVMRCAEIYFDIIMSES